MKKPKKIHLQSIRSVNRFSRTNLITSVIIFAAIGGYTIYSSFAAGFTTTFEAENATKNSPATVIADSNASGGNALKFGMAVPVQCANGGNFLWSNLEICGWAGPANTGPDMSKCPSGLTNSGAMTINTANTVVNCKNITGGIAVNAQNVTIQNSKVSFDGGGEGGSGVISINDGASAIVDHVDIDGLNHTHACIFNSGLKGSTLQYSLVAKNVNCHNVNDGMFSWFWQIDSSHWNTEGAGSDFIIQDNYFHDFTQNAANGHIDGFQTEGAWNGTISHNTFKMFETPNDVTVSGGGMDSAIALWDDFNGTPTAAQGGIDRTVNNINVLNNLIAGGGFSVYAEDRSPGSGAPGDTSPVGGNEEKNIHFTNNKFSTFLNGGCVGDFGIWFYRGPAEENPNLIWPPYNGGPTGDWGANSNTRSGNIVLETGENVDNNNPHSGGRLCT